MNLETETEPLYDVEAQPSTAVAVSPRLRSSNQPAPLSEGTSPSNKPILLAEGVPFDADVETNYLTESQARVKLAQRRFGLAYSILVTLPVMLFYDDYFRIEARWECLLLYLLVATGLLRRLLIEYENILWSSALMRTAAELSPPVECACILKLCSIMMFRALKLVVFGTLLVLGLSMIVFVVVQLMVMDKFDWEKIFRINNTS
mmetsp:Transcript_9409/g.16360  ORF Transcript_9409/g.16360 Transcript_9409/m.16360 type:complete len:204 (-) Transcript_9409:76-687(-)|eukprot:CAMPEP_0183724526 /NCGR_PEP_ID=MMETSP0737-20130205/17987_1 /TAXON_ID=385413 /ORGANISM="Thalassiosira miniscula, Strain CCMP1093" /LENGTH=203 /DNA_ID=CAMNT_0025955133 /DNA_START=118 /DNA_END=729 /DNA_ORIENTATION=-